MPELPALDTAREWVGMALLFVVVGLPIIWATADLVRGKR